MTEEGWGFKRAAKERGKILLRRVFEFGQRLGLDILPRHFYSSVPDIGALRQRTAWRQPRSMIGVRGAALDEQVNFLADCCAEEERHRLAKGDIFRRACDANGAVGYGPLEADMLFAFIANKRPTRVVQVGAGVSTAVILAAAEESRHPVEVTCVEPYPTEFLRRKAGEGRIVLISERAQDVSDETLLDLGQNGMLFIDSTHTVKPDSEVNRLVFEIMPRLSSGTFVHFHDIAFPFDYQRGLMSTDLFFWGESPLLHAFLIHNNRCTLRVALSMLHYACPDQLQRFLPNYRPQPNDDGLSCGSADGTTHFPSAAYLQMTS